MKTMTTLNLPQKCWIFEKRRYILEGGVLPKLPHVGLEYEAILKSNGIPYRKTFKVSDNILFPDSKEVCAYWNPEVGIEEEEIILPLVARMPDGSYMSCEKNFSANTPTDETIEAAQKTEKFVEQEIENYNQILREVHHYQFAKEKLADGVAVVCLSDDTLDYSDYKITTDYNSFIIASYEINMNYDRFIIFRPLKDCVSWVAIFNMNKVAPNGYLTLQVPKHIAGGIIGKGGSNIKAWAEKIGVKRIQVFPI